MNLEEYFLRLHELAKRHADEHDPAPSPKDNDSSDRSDAAANDSFAR